MGTFFGHQFFNWWKELSFIGGNRIIWITDRQWWNSNCSAAQLINITEGVISWSTGGVQGQGNNRNRDNWSIITQSYLLSSQFTDSFRHNAHWKISQIVQINDFYLRIWGRCRHHVKCESIIQRSFLLFCQCSLMEKRNSVQFTTHFVHILPIVQLCCQHVGDNVGIMCDKCDDTLTWPPM